MKIASLDHEPSYLALSYVWGDAPPSQPVYINGHKTFITPNLESALAEWSINMEIYDCPKLLWADAICINQKDMEEKMVQIKLMSVIYSAAFATCAWFGTDIPETELAFVAIKPPKKEIVFAAIQKLAKFAEESNLLHVTPSVISRDTRNARRYKQLRRQFPSDIG